MIYEILYWDVIFQTEVAQGFIEKNVLPRTFHVTSWGHCHKFLLISLNCYTAKSIETCLVFIYCTLQFLNAGDVRIGYLFRQDNDIFCVVELECKKESVTRWTYIIIKTCKHLLPGNKCMLYGRFDFIAWLYHVWRSTMFSWFALTL